MRRSCAALSCHKERAAPSGCVRLRSYFFFRVCESPHDGLQVRRCRSATLARKTTLYKKILVQVVQACTRLVRARTSLVYACFAVCSSAYESRTSVYELERVSHKRCTRLVQDKLVRDSYGFTSTSTSLYLYGKFVIRARTVSSYARKTVSQ